MHWAGQGQRMHWTWTQVWPAGQSAAPLHPDMHSPGPSLQRPQTLPAPQSASVWQVTAPGRTPPPCAPAPASGRAALVGGAESVAAGTGTAVLPVTGAAGVASRAQALRTSRRSSDVRACIVTNRRGDQSPR